MVVKYITQFPESNLAAEETQFFSELLNLDLKPVTWEQAESKLLFDRGEGLLTQALLGCPHHLRLLAAFSCHRRNLIGCCIVKGGHSRKALECNGVLCSC